ncbi:unnamed protein product, partial [Arabidopsis halleri]
TTLRRNFHRIPVQVPLQRLKSEDYGSRKNWRLLYLDH